MIYGRFVPCRSAYRITARAPTVSIERRYLLPCLVMPPSRSLPLLQFCFGTSPTQAAKLRAEANARGSGTVGLYDKTNSPDITNRSRPPSLAM
jgi:hypothetical protein